MSEPVQPPEPADPRADQDGAEPWHDHWADLREADDVGATRAPLDASRVAVLVVAHNGATWLPTVLEGLGAQSVQAGRYLAVDTGSVDGSGALLDAAFGSQNVVDLPEATPFGEAVQRALTHLDPQTEWLWILHDDCTPAPDALEQLLDSAAGAAAPGHPGSAARVDAVGPKLREWPSLRRLLEVGATISGTARRETGLERGEYDQGQYDTSQQVLAVNSAGMLVRPALLADLGGFATDLPVLGADLDLGWRAAAAGRRIVTAPGAVVFHAEAGLRGRRDSTLMDARPFRTERRAQVFVLLANCSRRRFVFAYLRILVGAILRTLGFLVTRRPRTAGDELAAVFAVCLRPGRVLRARRWRRRTRTVPDSQLRHLLAPWWIPFRHGLDAISDLGAALTVHASDVADRRRVARAESERERLEATRSGTRAAHPEEDDELADESGWLARYLTSPVALTLTAVVVLMAIGARAAFGTVSGGALAPAPAETVQWWTLHLASVHPIGTGTDVPAPPYVVFLALLSTLLPGGPSVAVSVILIGSFPLALWGAWRLLGVASRLVDPRGASPWLLGAGAVTYAVLPAVSGAWATGRFGITIAAALLPWVVHAALGFADPERERRWRAAWRTGLGLSLLTAFVPFAWWLVMAAMLGAAAFAAVLLGIDRLRSREVRSGVLAPVGLATLIPAVLLSPWLVPSILQGEWVSLVGEAGRLPYAVLSPTDLLLAQVADSGAADSLARWIGPVLVLGALLALIPRTTRIAVVGCWGLAVAMLVPAAVLALPVFSLAPGDSPAAIGFVVIVLAGLAIVATVLGGLGLQQRRGAEAQSRSGAVLGLVPTIALAACALGGLVWFVGPGASVVADDREDEIPAYMAQYSERSPSYGVVVIEGTIDDGVAYTLRREDGLRLGEDEIAALEPADEEFADNLRRVISNPTEADLDELRAAGVSYLVLAAPGDSRIRSTLDSISGLQPASAPQQGMSAWELVDQPADDTVEEAGTGVGRWVLLGVQAIAAIVVVVMAGPSRPGARRGEDR